MKRSTLFAILAGCVGASVVSAQPLNLAESSSLNRFGVSFRPGFNIQASFSGLGGFAARTDPGPDDTSASVNRNYDDGYNRIDVSGNVGRQTGYWGYNNASQTPAGLDVVVMNSSSSPAVGTSPDRGGDPQLGFEFTYNRQLGHLGKCAWGLELAFNFTDVDIQDRSTVYAPVNRISDAYSLGGITAPFDQRQLTDPSIPAYAGTFSGPGAWISDIPVRTRQVLPNGAAIVGERTINASLYGWRLGPYLDVPLGSRVALSFSAGLAVAYVDSDFRYTEAVTISGVGTETHAGAGNRDEALFGGYVGGLVSVAVSQQVNVFAGVQYQNVGTFRQTVGGKTAALDLGQSIFMTVGFGVSF